MNKHLWVIIFILISTVAQASDRDRQSLFEFESRVRPIDIDRQIEIDKALAQFEKSAPVTPSQEKVFIISDVKESADLEEVDPADAPLTQAQRQVIYEREMKNPPKDPEAKSDIAIVREELGIQEHQTEFGIEYYSYSYEESVEGQHFMDVSGNKPALYLKHTYRLEENPVADVYRMEAQYAGWGDLTYDGGGGALTFEVPSTIDRSFELRGLVGKDIVVGNNNLITPYVGYGYRRLDNHIGEITVQSSTFSNTKRQSAYQYIPVGIEGKFALIKGWRLTANAEYDYLISGRQTSNLWGIVDLINNQQEGFGLRGSLRFSKEYGKYNFIFEPFFRYWDIEDSEIATVAITPTLALVGLEPSNRTTETGVKLGIEF